MDVIPSAARNLHFAFLLGLTTDVAAQERRDSSFFRKHDGKMALGFLAGSVALSAFDTRASRARRGSPECRATRRATTWSVG
jgi:hypothetical protein